MWKSLLDALLESCIAMDPVACIYWCSARREPAHTERTEDRPQREEKVVALERRWETWL